METNVKMNWVTMITPFTKENEIDYDCVKEMIEWYVKGKVDGIFAVCQSSEMFYLSLREREKLGRFIIEQVAGRISVVVSGHVSDSIVDQIDELKIMAELKPDVLVLVSNRLCKENETEEVWKKNAQRILDAIPDVDFGIYECPYPYKRLLSPELLKWCAQTGRFAFLKDTCCNLDQLKAKKDAVKGSRLKIYNANSATLLESLKIGIDGFCGVMLNFHPELYYHLCKSWDKDEELARKLQHFATVASLIELQLYPTNAKYHMQLGGVSTQLYTRSKKDFEFSGINRVEVQHLYNMWQDYRLILGL